METNVWVANTRIDTLSFLDIFRSLHRILLSISFLILNRKELNMNIIGSDETNYIVRCEKCNSIVTLNKDKCFIQHGKINSRLPIKCTCGNIQFRVEEDEMSISSQSAEDKNAALPKATTKEDKVFCPKCNSTQIASFKKGFGAGRAVVGAALAGPIGLLGGFLGSNQLVITCMKCGHKWKPGK